MHICVYVYMYKYCSTHVTKTKQNLLNLTEAFAVQRDAFVIHEPRTEPSNVGGGVVLMHKNDALNIEP